MESWKVCEWTCKSSPLSHACWMQHEWTGQHTLLLWLSQSDVTSTQMSNPLALCSANVYFKARCKNSTNWNSPWSTYSITNWFALHRAVIDWCDRMKTSEPHIKSDIFIHDTRALTTPVLHIISMLSSFFSSIWTVPFSPVMFHWGKTQPLSPLSCYQTVGCLTGTP